MASRASRMQQIRLHTAGGANDVSPDPELGGQEDDSSPYPLLVNAFGVSVLVSRLPPP